MCFFQRDDQNTAERGNRTIDRLELAIDSSPDTATDYNPASSNAMNNMRVESFDFEGLVNRFGNEQYGYGCNPPANIQAWALSSALTSFYLGGSNSMVMGGDVSDYYAHQGTLSGLSLPTAQTVLASASLGSSQQAITGLTAQTSGAVRL